MGILSFERRGRERSEIFSGDGKFRKAELSLQRGHGRRNEGSVVSLRSTKRVMHQRVFPASVWREEDLGTYLFIVHARIHIVVLIHPLRIASRATVELDAIGSRRDDGLSIWNRIMRIRGMRQVLRLLSRRRGFKLRRLLLGIETRGHGSGRSIGSSSTLRDRILVAAAVEFKGGRGGGGGIGIHADELVLAGRSRR